MAYWHRTLDNTKVQKKISDFGKTPPLPMSGHRFPFCHPLEDKGDGGPGEVLGWLQGICIANERLPGSTASQRKISPAPFPVAIHFPSCDHAHAETLPGLTGMCRPCNISRLPMLDFDTVQALPVGCQQQIGQV